MLLQVVWAAWLSTLGHAPSVMDLADSQNVHQFTDTASIMVDKFVPVSFQVCLLLMSPFMNHCHQSLSPVVVTIWLLLYSVARLQFVLGVSNEPCCDWFID